MGFGLGRALAAPLLLFNFIVFTMILGFAGWAMNHMINGQGIYGNNATPYYIPLALIAGVIGIASVIAGLHHLRSWGAGSLAAAIALALASLLLTLLAFGLACKEIRTSKRGHRLKALEALTIIATLSSLLYYLILHAGHVNNRYGPSYNRGHDGAGGPGTGYTGTDKPGV